MTDDARAKLLRKSSAAVAATAMSLSALFTSIPVSSADPFDDDGGGSYAYDDSGSYDDGGYDDSYNESADEGNYGDSDSGDYFDTGDFEEPVGDSDEGNGFGGDEPPSNSPEEQPGNGFGGDQPPASSPEEQPGNGFGGDQPPSSSPEEQPGNGFGGDQPPSNSPEEHPGNGFGGDQPPSNSPEEHPGNGFGGDQPPSNSPEEHPGNGFGGDEHPGGSGDPDGGNQLTPHEEAAPVNDVAVAENAKAVQIASETMTSETVTSYSKSIQTTFTGSNYSNNGNRLRSPVSQWNSKWTGYDHFYRPVFTNPYSTPMKILYRADGKQQVLTVPPMEKAVLSTRMKPGVYSFTSMTGPENGPPTKVSVGSFSGGGFKPRPDQAPPVKPVVQKEIKNPLVQVKFAQGTSEPFRVSSLIDLGKDSSMKDATRVLLDGEIPAWGEWSKSEKGEQQFVITETQLLPGVKPPGQEPLPGYNIKLMSAQKPLSWLESNKTMIVIAGTAAGLLALVLVAFIVLKRRRSEKSPDHLATAVIDYSDSPTVVVSADEAGVADPAADATTKATQPSAPDYGTSSVDARSQSTDRGSTGAGGADRTT